MKFVFGLVAAAMLATAPVSDAFARSISTNDIADMLSDEGYAVQDLQPNIIAVIAGEYVVVVGVDGPDGDVSYITYLGGVTIGDVGHEFLSKFNSEVKFARAYVDRDGDITLQMDRNSAGGVSLQNIKSDFEVFLRLVAHFLSSIEAQATA